MIFVAAGAAVGTLLALLHSRILLLILASAFFAIVVTLYGLLLGHHLGLSALVGFGSVAMVQLSYLALSLNLDLFPSQNFAPQLDLTPRANFMPRANLTPQVQAAIGRELRAEMKVPCDLSPKLAALVLRLEAA
jgi:hypothetical protein